MSQRGILLIAITISLPFSRGLSEDALQYYQSPNFFESVFEPGSGTNANSSEPGSAEVQAALNKFGYSLNNLIFQTSESPEIQSKVLALSFEMGDFRLKSEIALIDLCLKSGKSLDDSFIQWESQSPSAESDGGAPRRNLTQIQIATDLLFQLKGLVSNHPEGSRKFVPYFADIINGLELGDVGIRNSLAAFSDSKTAAVWSNLASVEENPVTETKPGIPSGMAAMTAGNGEFKRRQSLIKGLLVAPLEGSEYAGQASQMSATVINASSAEDPTKITFNQDVGESMLGALEKVQKYHSIRNDGIPRGGEIHISFEEQYSSKDGPSAAVACSLLLESLITDQELDGRFAVTGDMNSDGTVQPVGGIDGKIRGATNRDCSHVAIPAKNTRVLTDMVVAGDIKPLIDIQIFSLKKFDDALDLAKVETERSPKLQEAMKTFDEVQKVLQKTNGQSYVKNSHVLSRLREVLKAAPNHESARLLLMEGEGRSPSKLSLLGSLNQIDRVTKPIMVVMKTGNVENSVDDLMSSIFALRRMRTRLDPRTKACSDALEDLSGKLKELGDSKLSSAGTKYQDLIDSVVQSWDKVGAEYKRIESDPRIQEELQ